MTQQLMTVDLLKVALPKHHHGNATQELADTINQLAHEPETCEMVRQNFLTYSKVLTEGKYKTDDYLSAVQYVTHKLMGYSNKDAYVRTFPARYQSMTSRGITDISPYVAGYHKTQLVMALLSQSLIPAHLLYQDAFHSAVQTQMRLMVSAASEKVQAEAANSILTHLKAPEIKKVEMDVNVKQNGGIDDLRRTMAELAQNQLDLIKGGHVTAGQMARTPINVTQAEKDAAIDVVATVKVEPIAAQEIQPEQSVGGACEHGTPYRYMCESCVKHDETVSMDMGKEFDDKSDQRAVVPVAGDKWVNVEDDRVYELREDGQWHELPWPESIDLTWPLNAGVTLAPKKPSLFEGD